MKNLKLITLALFVPLHFFSQGLNFSSAEELSQISEAPSDYGFATDLPTKYSLEKYVPPVKRQVGSTCVGFSTFYYALSTMYNIEFNIIKESDKLAHSFDPYFIYSLSYINTDNCDAGLNFKPVFTKLNEIGSKKLFYPPFTSCDEKWTEEKFVNTVSYTQAYSINQYYKIPIERPDFNELVKQAITYKLPVVIGLETTNSMDPYSSSNTSGIGSSGLWTPSANEKGAGGHALCVVGYDNSMFGGSFRIVNSWGERFGDNGYMWITYDDFKKVQIKLGTILEVKKNEKARMPSLVLKVDFGEDVGIKQSSAQITHYYNKESLIGKQVIGVCNFPTKNIAGVVSEVLILGAIEKDGKVVLVHPSQKTKNGLFIA